MKPYYLDDTSVGQFSGVNAFTRWFILLSRHYKLFSTKYPYSMRFVEVILQLFHQLSSERCCTPRRAWLDRHLVVTLIPTIDNSI